MLADIIIIKKAPGNIEILGFPIVTFTDALASFLALYLAVTV